MTILPPNIPCAEMDGRVPVDSRVFMKKRALRKYLHDIGLTEVVRPDGWQYS